LKDYAGLMEKTKESKGDDDEDVPELVGTNFEETAEK
jgi:hypothetical protein